MQRAAMLALWFGLIIAPAAAFAQQPDRPATQPDNVVLQESAPRQLSPHVFVIYGNPNIAIVVGARAMLVVDTGLGRRNGAYIAGEVSKLRKSARLFLTTTHAHPEHASGQDGFPPDTIVIRPKVQQQELDEIGATMIETFRSRNETNRELLADARVGKSISCSMTTSLSISAMSRYGFCGSGQPTPTVIRSPWWSRTGCWCRATSCRTRRASSSPDRAQASGAGLRSSTRWRRSSQLSSSPTTACWEMAR
jgi:hypothetical protein